MGLFGPPNVAKLKATRNVSGLMKALAYTKDNEVVIAAASALGEMGDLPDVAALIGTLRNREATAAYWVQRRDWKKCSEIGVPAIDQLVDLAVRAVSSRNKPATAESDHAGAARALADMGSPAVGALIGLIEIYLRTFQGLFGEPASDPSPGSFADEWRKKTGWDAVIAAEALGMIGDARAVKPIATMATQRGFLIRAVAIDALGRIDDPSTIEPLIGFLKDPDPKVQEVAARALKIKDDPRAAAALGAAGEPSAGAKPLAKGTSKPVAGASPEPSTLGSRQVQGVVVLSRKEMSSNASHLLLAQAIQQQELLGHTLPEDLPSAHSVCDDPEDAEFAAMLAGMMFPSGTAGSTKSFPFQTPDGNSGAYYVVFDR